jgi:2-C-methyl-D-erythritol 4-phosphate cytidylyltransferase
VAVQTPQAFPVDVLRRAHRGDPDATDDAALVEALGLTVSVVPGDPDNLKLTAPADLARAELLVVR